MMEKRAPRLMETNSLLNYESSFDKMANHVKDLHAPKSGDVSKSQPIVGLSPPKPYQMPSFDFMNKGRK